METTVKGREELILQRLSVYTFLQKFYYGELNQLPPSKWEKLRDWMIEEMSYYSNENMLRGAEILSNFINTDLDNLEFDFNRLFVGPKRLEASPYESTYRNTDRALMQKETLAVRKFYETAGLVLCKKNSNPDDHLAIELEFICYLLENSLEDEDCKILYQEFLKKHLFQWVEKHCELVREKATNTIIIGVSYILQGLIEIEKKQLNVRRR